MTSTALPSLSLVDVAAQYPVARAKQEHWHAFIGPTNSGKSHRAFNALARAESGLYLAPLRLLAMEGQQQMQERGCVTSLLTGDHREMHPDARFTAATVEMLNLVTPVDAGVIDEIQLLRDPSRGWAWTQALLGMPARTVYLTGSPDIVDTLYALAEHVGVTLEIEWTERLAELTVHEQPTRLKDVRPHTAIVAFGRQHVLQLRATLEHRGLRVAVIYGDLTPAVRRAEALRFTTGEAQVLIATDAIALGLNLQIETILFAATDKFDGETERPLTPNEIRQIGGRAGRYLQFPMGYVGVLEGANLDAVRSAITAALPTQHNPAARELAAPVDIRPTRDALVAAAGVRTTPARHVALDAPLGVGRQNTTAVFMAHAQRPTDHAVRLVHVASRYLDTHRPFSSLFCFTLGDAYLFAASLVDDITPMPFILKTLFACAPVDLQQPTLRAKFVGWAWAAATGHTVGVATLTHRSDCGFGWAHCEADLEGAEQHAQLLLLYAWLHQRLPASFPEGLAVAALRRNVDGYIARTLARPMATWFGIRTATAPMTVEDAYLGGNGSLTATMSVTPPVLPPALPTAPARRNPGHRRESFVRAQPAVVHFTAPKAIRSRQPRSH